MFRREPLSTDLLLTSRVEFPFTDEESVLPDSSVRNAAGVVSARKSYIAKPHGEVSRISRGGYNLEEALGWSKADYTAVQVFLLYRNTGFSSLTR